VCKVFKVGYGEEKNFRERETEPAQRIRGNVPLIIPLEVYQKGKRCPIRNGKEV